MYTVNLILNLENQFSYIFKSCSSQNLNQKAKYFSNVQPNLNSNPEYASATQEQSIPPMLNQDSSERGGWHWTLEWQKPVHKIRYHANHRHPGPHLRMKQFEGELRWGKRLRRYKV